MEDVIGGASAATLGFITGGIKGGKYAYDLYSNFARRRKPRMPAIPRNASQKRKSKEDSGYKTVKKIRTKSGRGKVKRVSTPQGGNNNNQVVKANVRKGDKVKRKGLKKPVKVPTKLRKQIQKVMENEAIFGKYLSIHYWAITPGVPFQTTSVVDQNSFEYVGYPSQSGATTPENRLLFSPQYVRYAVSRLCGNLAAQRTLRWDLTDTNDCLDAKTCRVKVLKQSATFRMRNNTARTVSMRIMCWSPKSTDYSSDVGTTPLDIWSKALSDQAGSQGTHENPTITTIFTLYNHPKYASQVRNMYNIEDTIVDIPAGKEYVYKVDGPAMTYDYAKYWKENKFYDMQKFTKQVVITACNDLVKTSLNAFGRYTDMTVASSGGVVIEQTGYIKFSVPEQVGFLKTTPVVGGAPQNLDYRRYAFGIDNFQDTQTGAVSYIGDENPQNTAQANA